MVNCPIWLRMGRQINSHIFDAHTLLAGLEAPEHEGLRDAMMVLLMRRVFMDKGARPGMEHLAALASLTCDSVPRASPRPPAGAQVPRLRVVASNPKAP